MSFTALNLSAEDIEYDAEEHTRELQIEQAFRSFQTALKLQKDSRFQEANKEYHELFSLDVVSDLTRPINSPSIRTLRYLAHRNRGLLHLEELKSSITALPMEKAMELFLGTVDDLVICLDHSDGDLKVEAILLSIFELLKNDRLARFVIEYELTNEQNDDTVIHKRNRFQTEEFRTFFQERQDLLARIGVLKESVHRDTPALLKGDLSFLKPVLDYLCMRRERFLEGEHQSVKLESESWKCIAVALDALVSKPKSRAFINEDSYSNCEDPITKIQFELPTPEPGPGPDGKLSEESDSGQVFQPPETGDLPSLEKVQNPDETKKRKFEDMPQRASKRFKEQSDSGDSSEGIDETRFLNEVNWFLGHVNLKMDIDSKVLNSENADFHLHDFHNALISWSLRHSDVLFQEEKYQQDRNPSNSVITELFNSASFADESNSDSPAENLSDDGVAKFIAEYSGSHYIKVRSALISKLLSLNQYSCPITDKLFEKELYTALENLILSANEILFNQCCSSKVLGSFAIAVYEVLINRWIGINQSMKLRGSTPKQLNDLTASLEMIEPIILRWKKLLTTTITGLDQVLRFRFRWVTLLFVQHSQTASMDLIKDLFSHLHTQIADSKSELDIRFFNYDFIPALNLSSVKEQSEKFNVLNSFERTFNSENREQTVLLLQHLLLPVTDNRVLSTEEQAMIKFISEGSPSLSLKLWKILLGYYSDLSDVIEYQKSLITVFNVLSNTLHCDQYSTQSDQQRQQILITTLAYYSDYIGEFAQLVQSNGWIVAEAGCIEVLEGILPFLKFLYVYTLFEKSMKGAPVKNKAFLKFREAMISTTCVILLLYHQITKSDKVLGFFNVFHEEIGELKFCDARNGMLLSLAQHFLKDVDSTTFEAEILQHLQCRFNISISSDTFIPFDHGTTPLKFDKESAYQFAPYLLSTLKKRHHLFHSSSKQDLRHGLDVLLKTIGEPDLNDSLFQRNENVLNSYLNQSLDLKLFRNALLGELMDNYQVGSDRRSKLYQDGLLYLEGIINLNLYKSRKKTGQAKNSDLELIIKMLRTDLICGTNRLESWFALGQAYAFQAEDDLTWTSDKLNSPAKKLSTADVQKKAILCYLMSASIIVFDPSAIDNSIKSAVFALLGREIYHSLMRPMDGYAFISSSNSKTMTEEDGIVKLSYDITQDKKYLVLKTTIRIFQISMSFDPKDWLSTLYLVKTSHKLKRPIKKVLQLASKCCIRSPQGIEPHYFLCSLIFKYYNTGKLDGNDAASVLTQAPLFKDLVITEPTHDMLANIVISALRKLVILDKRKWYHQPRFRISKILHDMGEHKKAFNELESLIVLKSTNKNLVSIWKPEFEAPGKHFVYITTYIDYYMKLAFKLADFQSLILFNRKLRRYGASMISLPTAWELSLSFICSLAKEIVDAPASFTDVEVPKLNYSEFMNQSSKITDLYRDKKLEPLEIPILVLLYELSEIRRMNNGFGSTSLTDDTFNVIYLKFFLPYVQNSEILKEGDAAPTRSSADGNPTKTKVARRDIIAVGTNFCKVIETEIKNYRISDDIGFDVPSNIVHAHLNSPRINEKVDENGKHNDDTILLAVSNKTDPGRSKDQAVIDKTINPEKTLIETTETASQGEATSLNTTPQPITEPKTPERVPHDASSDVEEFHTPSEMMN